jgi:hypothetical protein
MLSEKFILLLETFMRRNYPHGAPRPISNSPHVPVKLPATGSPHEFATFAAGNEKAAAGQMQDGLVRPPEGTVGTPR